MEDFLSDFSGVYIHVLMRDEKEERLIHTYMLMRDAEGRKKEASKVKQTNKAKQHSTPKAVTSPCTPVIGLCSYIHVYILRS